MSCSDAMSAESVTNGGSAGIVGPLSMDELRGQIIPGTASGKDQIGPRKTPCGRRPAVGRSDQMQPNTRESTAERNTVMK